jgi:ATP-binding cassette subfamily B protein
MTDRLAPCTAGLVAKQASPPSDEAGREARGEVTVPPRAGGMGTMGMGLRSLRQDRSVLQHRVKKGTTKRMLRFAVPYRRILSVFLPAVLLDAAVAAVNPLILRAIIDRGILAHKTEVVIVLAALAAGLAIADSGLQLLERYLSARIGEGLIFDLRSKVFRHIQRMPLAFFSRTQTGALVSRLNNDVIGAQQAFTDLLSNIVGNLVTVAIVLAAMFILSWQITLVSLVLLPLFLIPARLVGRHLGSMTKESYDLNAEMNTVMSERFNVAGALLVKLFGRPGAEATNFDDKAARVRDIGVAQATYARVFFVALTLTASLATAFVYGFGGVQAAKGAMAVGTVVALTSYLTRLYAPLTQLSNLNLDVMTTLVSFERLFEVLDLVPLIDESKDAVEIDAGPARIEFSHVDFSYPTAEEVSLASLEVVARLEQTAHRQVLHDVSFTVEPGQLVALVGPSGAGKTTISMLVPRLYDVSDGAVRINGTDVREATFASLRDRIGVVTQDPHLLHDTLRANLLYARPGASEEELFEALARAQILPLVETLPQGLDTVVGERGYRFSGGEKQRVALARLMLKEPDIVVLDEATSHLDSESEAAVQRALETALAGRTSLVIAHRLSTVRGADQLLVVDGGRIVEHGTHEELISEGGLYAELYRTQFKDQATVARPVAAAGLER